MAPQIIILGAGITGLATALALHKYLPSPKPRITIYEIRASPSTIGGAVNLTPKALRYLDHLGVYQIFEDKKVGAECRTIELFDLYSGTKYAEVDFRGADGNGIGKGEGKKFFSRRVMRCEIQDALLQLVREQDGTEIVFGKKAVEVTESAEGVRLKFEDGESVIGDCLLGCDGIHSATRSLLVDPERKPTYTGISVGLATSTLKSGAAPPPWTTTGLVSSRRGSLMCSYFEATKSQHYVGAVMEVADVGSREGWKAKGTNQETIKRDLLERFGTEKVPAISAILEGVGEWTLYPVYALPEGGKWRSEQGKVVLLGDSAHAVSLSSCPYLESSSWRRS